MKHHLVNPIILDTQINSQLDRILVSIYKSRIYSHNSKQIFQSLDAIEQEITALKTLYEKPSLSYLKVKNLLLKHYNGELELDGLNILFSFVDNPDASRCSQEIIKTY